MDAIEALKTRRSVRAYRPESVPRQIIEDIVDCARLAPTGRNEQPWEFVVVTMPDLRREIAGIMESGRFIADAPVCIAVCCRDTQFYLEDGSAAIVKILVAARAHGLGSCWVSGDKNPNASRVARLLGVPTGHKLVGLVAIGKAAEEPALPEKRKLSEVLHWERFGKGA